MRILVNGDDREVPEGSSLAVLVPHAEGVAVALNGAVVRNAEWSVTWLDEGDAVEVLTAFQGG